MKKVIAALGIAAGIAALAAAPAFAAAWVQAATGPSGAVWYVDADSIKAIPSEDGALKAWIKIDYAKDSAHAPGSTRLLGYFKCDSEEQKLIDWIDYRPDGSLAKDNPFPTATYKPVPPGSLSEQILTVICKH